MTDNPDMPAKRYQSLDGIRGVCVIVVVFCHIVFHYQGAWLPTIPGIGVLWNGSCAVVIFFILSGFVLSLSIEGGKLPWRYFIIRRYLRLYPPFAIAVLLSAFLAIVTHTATVLGQPLDVRYWTWSLLTLTDRYYFLLNGPLWSMIQEFRLALFFPLVFMAVRRAPLPTLVGCAVFATYTMMLPDSSFALEIYRTSVVTTCFALGAALAVYRTPIAACGARIQGWYWLAAIPILILLSLNPEAPMQLWLKWAIYLSCTVAVAASFATPLLDRALSTPAPQFFGRISYSLYLIHTPLFDFVFPQLLPSMPGAVALVLTIPLMMAATLCLYHYVEVPAIRWSHSRLATPRATAIFSQP